MNGDRVLDNLLLLALICACGAFVSGLAGFGSGLVLMGTLVAFMDIQVASSVTANISLGLALANMISVWKHVPLERSLAPVFVAWCAGKTVFARLSDDRFRWIEL